MKRFLLGTFFGAAAGFVFSCLTDSDGNRPGKPLKDEFEALKHEGNRFNEALNKAKQASRDLSEQLPAAERTVSDISDDIEKYSRHIQPTVDRMKQKGDEISQDLDSLTASDAQTDKKD
ncbi:MAG: hypothetical protein ACI4T3_00700 [Lactobacillus sp.]